MATGLEAVPACLSEAVPVFQPPHLEGDASLATEILPGPPPLASIQQPRKDHKKITPAFSYLPVSDPGTTYGPMVNPLVTTVSSTEAEGPRRKRARLDKSLSTTRAQRASARNLTALGASEVVGEGVASSSHLAQDSDAPTMPLDIDETTMSRSTSVAQADDVGIPNSNKRPRRDKGKGREKEAIIRVKEEPVVVSLSLHDAAPALPNEDHCSSCRSIGALVYCDGCPRAFHLWCLNPPIAASDVPEGDTRWFCPACELRQKPPGKVPASFKFMVPLIDQLQNALPIEFQLPQDIRSFFKDVATGSKGTYVDSSEIKAPRLNRHGQLEDRDPYRLKDRNGDPVLCFKCGTSALPSGLAASAPSTKRPRRAASLRNSSESGRALISCDYCHLHWHLDCVDPPMPFVPPWEKRWMCPNHADQVYNPKRRTPRHNPSIVEVFTPGVPNNGNIDVIQPEAPAVPPPAKVGVDEVLINGRRYRVPERIITMDFWNKVNPKRDKREGWDHSRTVARTTDNAISTEDESGLSSPLTELSSLDDIEELGPMVVQKGLFNVDELNAALFLCGLQQHLNRPAIERSAGSVEAPMHLEDNVGTIQFKEKRTALSAQKEQSIVSINGVSKTEHATKIAARSTRSIASSSRPLRSSAGLRSQHTSKKEPHLAKTEVPQTNDTHTASCSAQVTNSSPRIPTPSYFPHSNGTLLQTPSLSSVTAVPQSSNSSTSTRPKRSRQPPRGRQSPTIIAPLARSTNHSDNDPDALTDTKVGAETTQHSSSQPLAVADPQKVFRPTPYWPLPVPKPNTPVSAPSTVAPTSTPANKPESSSTPSLKIRLPRLGSIKQQSTVTAPPTVPDNSTRTRTSTRGRPKKVHNTRPRRSHRQASASLNDKSPDLLLPPV